MVFKSGQRTEREECDNEDTQKFKSLKLQSLRVQYYRRKQTKESSTAEMGTQKRNFGLGQGFSTSVLSITSFDNSKYLQTLPNVSWWTKPPLVENHRFIIMVVFQTGGQKVSLLNKLLSGTGIIGNWSKKTFS